MAQRYFLSLDTGKITGQDAHHIKKVLRMQVGDEIIVCAKGICHIARISAIEDDVFYEKIIELESPNTMDVTLIQGMPKGSKIETTLRYATMFGVSSFILVDMVRSIHAEKPSANKIKRFEMIIKEASELAHRFSMPTFEFKTKLQDIDYQSYDLVILADEKERAKPLIEALPKSIKRLKIALIIGPEGGIDDRERSYLKAQKAVLVSLGSNILSSEIAALYPLSVISSLND